MKILAIETSCDDTCVAILKIGNWKLEILSNVVSSQVKLHRKYGGVWPFLAKREHQRNLPIVLKKALKKAKNPKIDLIAVTIGPGLEPCLWTGINFAKDLAKKLNAVKNYKTREKVPQKQISNRVKAPIVPVNHIEAHILANFIRSNFQFPIFNFQTFFPAVCLIVSGGHTQLILVKELGKYKILGETRDDAAGECFDKVARILGLSYPGGPEISKLASKYKILNTRYKIQLPRPMIYQKNYDFSFAGLKTAVLYLVKQLTINNQQLTIQQKIEICVEVQQAIIDVLIYKTLKAVKEYQAKTIILGGGVVANKELRKQFRQKIKKEIPNTKYLIPDTKYCTDNAVMIGITACFHWLKGERKKIKVLEANANLRLK